VDCKTSVRSPTPSMHRHLPLGKMVVALKPPSWHERRGTSIAIRESPSWTAPLRRGGFGDGNVVVVHQVKQNSPHIPAKPRRPTQGRRGRLIEPANEECRNADHGGDDRKMGFERRKSQSQDLSTRGRGRNRLQPLKRTGTDQKM
jgi:hypothetical protein